MKISIIIPSYKPGNYLWECLDSLVNQTLSKELWEIILILNGCNEPYHSEIQNRYGQLLPNMIIVQTDVSGVSNARNIGINQSKGEYITFIDDDDLVSNNYLEHLLSNSSKNGITLSNILTFLNSDEKYDFKEFNRTKTFLSLHKKNNVSVYDARKLLNGPWIKLIPKSIIGDNNFNVNLKNGEDAVFMFGISKNIKKVSFTDPSAIYYIRQRTGSASSKNLSLIYWIKTAVRMDYILSKMFFSNMRDYSLKLYLNRIVAPWKKVIKEIF